MTKAQGIRVPAIQFSEIRFKEPLSLYATDSIQFDTARKIAMVVNSAGKVKHSTPYTVMVRNNERT